MMENGDLKLGNVGENCETIYDINTQSEKINKNKR